MTTNSHSLRRPRTARRSPDLLETGEVFQNSVSVSKAIANPVEQASIRKGGLGSADEQKRFPCQYDL